MRIVRIATVGSPSDYRQSLLPIIAQSLGFKINWVRPQDSNLVIFGPFANSKPKSLGWCPKILRPALKPLKEMLTEAIGPRKLAPLTLFQSAENIRYDIHKTDYSISFDLNIKSSAHFRLPYWMEMIDWSHEGVIGNKNPRYGPLLKIERLMQPLGNDFLKRNWGAAFLSSHIREPRKTLFDAVQKAIPVTGFGAHFNKNIEDHHHSGFLKHVLLQDFAFNLCPENGMYPGYYTEKIPEAFYAQCLPITWADENVMVDFNPNAFINLAPMAWCNYEPLHEILNSHQQLNSFAHQALILKNPSILLFRDFVKSILDDASS
jgi:hypothetical protein